MKTKSRATAAAASTDAAAAVAERSNPRGIAKKRRGRFLPRALSSVLASLSKLKLGTRTPPVSSKKKTTAAPVPRAEKPSSRAKRARSRRARAMRPAPEPARKPAPDSEQAVARSSAKSDDTRAGRKNKKNAEKKKQTRRALDGVHQRAAVMMKRPAKPRNAREKRREKKTDHQKRDVVKVTSMLCFLSSWSFLPLMMPMSKTLHISFFISGSIREYECLFFAAELRDVFD